jgi:hypothetical protein
MQKKFTENGLLVGPNNDLLVSLVSNEPDCDNCHDYEFVIYDLPTPVKNEGLVGVNDGENFALKFQMQHTQDRFAFAAYVDGVSVVQDLEVVRLSSIQKPEIFDSHINAMLIGFSERPKECTYLETFIKGEDAYPRLIFIDDEAKGVNAKLISEPSAMNKIEIFFWLERLSYSRSGVAEGENRVKEYPTSETLSEPFFLGKATFIHKNADELRHLGEIIVRNTEGA